MRLLLDAHVSGLRIAAPLRKGGHEVRAVDEERELDGWDDEALLALATAEKRVLITFDVKDFPDIARRWAEAGRPHCGLAIVVGVDHSEFGSILRALESLLQERSTENDWQDYTCFVSRSEEHLNIVSIQVVT